jgi:hypothetical protein
VVINTLTAEVGEYGDWVARFADLWAGGRPRLGDFMSILSPSVTLRAPGLRTTTGWEECQRAFARMFELLPDLTARIDRWSASGAALFSVAPQGGYTCSPGSGAVSDQRRGLILTSRRPRSRA